MPVMMFRPLLLLLVMMTGMSNGRAEVLYPWPGDTKVQLERKTPGGQLRGTLRVTNPGETPWLIQAWSEDAEGGRYSLVYPPLVRLEPGSNRDFTLYPGSEAEAGKLKWFLVKLIPPGEKEKRNQLVIPVIYRLKIVREAPAGETPDASSRKAED